MSPAKQGVLWENDRATSTANEVARSRRKTTPGLADQTFRRVIDVPSVPPTPTSVYRYYDKSSLLLYVGITSRGIRRQREHNHDKEWWPFVTKQEVEHYSTRATASAKKQGVLTQIDAYEDMPQLTFAGERGGIPGLRGVYIHLKVDCHAPFIARAHEAVGVKV